MYLSYSGVKLQQRPIAEFQVQKGQNHIPRFHLFSKVVVSIALYGSELWSNMTAVELNTNSCLSSWRPSGPAAQRPDGVKCDFSVCRQR